jgi:hypothetical protein
MRSRPSPGGVATSQKKHVVSALVIERPRQNGKHAVAGAPAPLDLMGRGHRWPGAIKIDAKIRAAILWREAGAP